MRTLWRMSAAGLTPQAAVKKFCELVYPDKKLDIKNIIGGKYLYLDPGECVSFRLVEGNRTYTLTWKKTGVPYGEYVVTASLR